MKTHKKLVTLKILDEVNVVFIGLRDVDTTYLVEKFKVFARNYRFSPKYTLGPWDGKIQFFYPTGKTYIQLVPEVMAYLSKQSYKIKLKDTRQKFDVKLPTIDENYLSDYGITLGKHQMDAVNALTQNQGGIFLGGTGAGKTYITAILAKLYYENLNLKTIIVVPTADLIDQTIAELKKFIDVGEYSGATKDTNHPCVVSTWQALQNNKAILSKFQIAIIDECHGVRGEVLRDMLNDHGKNICVKIGVTGTLPKDEIDKMAVRITLGNVQHITTAASLIKSGWLATPTLELLQLEEDVHDMYDEYLVVTKEKPVMTYAKFKQNAFDDYVAEKAYIRNNEERNEFIANKIEKLRTQKKGNTFILVNSVVYGKKLVKLIDDAHFVHGKDEKKARREIYDLFTENDDIVVIATFQLASTGLDIKRIFNLIFIDAGKSFIQIIQGIGRGLRKAHDKDSVYILDICSDFKYARRHLTQRMAHYRGEMYEFTKKKIDYLRQMM